MHWEIPGGIFKFVMRARVAPKFEDAVASFRRRGFIISEPSPDTDDAAAAAPPDVIWDNAAAIEFPTLPPTTFVNHLVRTSEFGHKVSLHHWCMYGIF